MHLPGEMWPVLPLEMQQKSGWLISSGDNAACLTGINAVEFCRDSGEMGGHFCRERCGLFDRDKCGRIPPGLRRDGGPFPRGEMRPFPHWKNAQNSAWRDVAISAGIDVVISAGRFAAKFRWDQMG